MTLGEQLNVPRTTSAKQGGWWNESWPAFLLLPTCHTPPTAKTAGVEFLNHKQAKVITGLFSV